MNGIFKFMLIVLTIIYVVSPVDLCPGPVDDFLVILFGMAANKQN